MKAIDKNVKVKAGYVGELRIKIPWRELGKKPVEVTFDRLHVLCEFRRDDDDEDDDDEEKFSDQDEKGDVGKRTERNETKVRGEEREEKETNKREETKRGGKFGTEMVKAGDPTPKRRS